MINMMNIDKNFRNQVNWIYNSMGGGNLIDTSGIEEKELEKLIARSMIVLFYRFLTDLKNERKYIKEEVLEDFPYRNILSYIDKANYKFNPHHGRISLEEMLEAIKPLLGIKEGLRIRHNYSITFGDIRNIEFSKEILRMDSMEVLDKFTLILAYLHSFEKYLTRAHRNIIENYENIDNLKIIEKLLGISPDKSIGSLNTKIEFCPALMKYGIENSIKIEQTTDSIYDYITLKIFSLIAGQGEVRYTKKTTSEEGHEKPNYDITINYMNGISEIKSNIVKRRTSKGLLEKILKKHKTEIKKYFERPKIKSALILGNRFEETMDILKEYLANNKNIESIIRLPKPIRPRGILRSNQIALIFNNKEQEKIFVFDINKYLKNSRKDDLEKIKEIYETKKEIERFSKNIDPKKLSKNNYSLNTEKYLITPKLQQEKLEELIEELKSSGSKEKLEKLRNETDNLLEEALKILKDKK